MNKINEFKKLTESICYTGYNHFHHTEKFFVTYFIDECGDIFLVERTIRGTRIIPSHFVSNLARKVIRYIGNDFINSIFEEVDNGLGMKVKFLREDIDIERPPLSTVLESRRFLRQWLKNNFDEELKED